MANEAITYIRCIPLTVLPADAGSGPVLPVVSEFAAPGTVLKAAIGVPAGTNVTVELWGAGAGGAGSPVGASPGGGGAGGGAYVMAVLTPEQWEDIVDLVGGFEGSGGAANVNGFGGQATTLRVAAGVVYLSAGAGGEGVAIGGVGGAGGVVTNPGGATIVTSAAGSPGVTATTAAGGAGGAGGGVGHGEGGAGGVAPSGAGGAGTVPGGGGGGGAATVGIGGTGRAGRARFSYTPS